MSGLLSQWSQDDASEKGKPRSLSMADMRTFDFIAVYPKMRNIFKQKT
jgi:hypothetical protein